MSCTCLPSFFFELPQALFRLSVHYFDAFLFPHSSECLPLHLFRLDVSLCVDFLLPLTIFKFPWDFPLQFDIPSKLHTESRTPPLVFFFFSPPLPPSICWVHTFGGRLLSSASDITNVVIPSPFSLFPFQRLRRPQPLCLFFHTPQKSSTFTSRRFPLSNRFTRSTLLFPERHPCLLFLIFLSSGIRPVHPLSLFFPRCKQPLLFGSGSLLRMIPSFSPFIMIRTFIAVSWLFLPHFPLWSSEPLLDLDGSLGHAYSFPPPTDPPGCPFFPLVSTLQPRRIRDY